MAKLTYCFIFIILVSCYNTPSLCCPHDQKQALLHFKNSLKFSLFNGADFRVFSSWNSTSDCCQWERVTCDLTFPTSQVIAIDLSSSLSYPVRSVSNSVLSPLFCLHSLQFLNLSRNGLTGAIPSSGLANLSELVVLEMSFNKFSGLILPQLFYLRKLRVLNLAYNFLNGEIPVEIGNLTELRELYLYSNSFLGVIPPQLFSLSKLIYLSLHENSFHGEIPMDIGNLTNLHGLSMGGNNFIGTIPVQLCYLRKLWVLNLHKNLLYGEIPAEITNLTNLQYLSLYNNNFSGGIPPSFQRLDKLILLALGGNNVSWGNGSMVPKSSDLEGTIPFWLSNFKNLVALDLHSNNLKKSKRKRRTRRDGFRGKWLGLDILLDF